MSRFRVTGGELDMEKTYTWQALETFHEVARKAIDQIEIEVANGRVTVSYTHLTLPTKRIV